MEEIFLQYGMAGLILGVLFVVIKMMMKHFTDTIAEDRKLMDKISTDFNKTVTNHMGHSDQDRKASIKAIDKNTEVLSKVLKVLDK